MSAALITIQRRFVFLAAGLPRAYWAWFALALLPWLAAGALFLLTPSKPVILTAGALFMVVFQFMAARQTRKLDDQAEGKALPLWAPLALLLELVALFAPIAMIGMNFELWRYHDALGETQVYLLREVESPERGHFYRLSRPDNPEPLIVARVAEHNGKLVFVREVPGAEPARMWVEGSNAKSEELLFALSWNAFLGLDQMAPATGLLSRQE